MSGRDLTLGMRVQIITEWVICLWPPLSLSLSLSLSLLLATDSRPRSGHYHRLRVSVWALSHISQSDGFHSERFGWGGMISNFTQKGEVNGFFDDWI